MAVDRSFAQRYHADSDAASAHSSPGTRSRPPRGRQHVHRQLSAAAGKAASASASPAAVFKNSGGLKARSRDEPEAESRRMFLVKLCSFLLAAFCSLP